MKISGVTYASQKNRFFKKPANLLFILVLIIVLCIIAIFAISVVVGNNLVNPIREVVSSNSSIHSLKYENVSFSDIKNDVKLTGWYFKGSDSSKTIILAHGYGDNRLPIREDTTKLIKNLQNKGYSILTFDFRNCGESEKSITSVGLFEKNDLLGAIKYMKSKENTQIILMGFSMGASTSIMAAAESKDVIGVISDSAFSNLESYLNDNLSKWSDLPSVPFNFTTQLVMKYIKGIDTTKVSPVAVIKNISPRPVLLIHSKDDHTVPYKNCQELLNASDKNTTQLWTTEKGGHINSFNAYEEEYTKRVTNFLEKAFSKK